MYMVLGHPPTNVNSCHCCATIKTLGALCCVTLGHKNALILKTFVSFGNKPLKDLWNYLAILLPYIILMLSTTVEFGGVLISAKLSPCFLRVKPT